MGVSIADITAGMYAVQGILAALYQREATGRGQKVDIATSLQRNYNGIKTNLTQAADKLADADYTFKGTLKK